jgi:hypothetical protein
MSFMGDPAKENKPAFNYRQFTLFKINCPPFAFAGEPSQAKVSITIANLVELRPTDFEKNGISFKLFYTGKIFCEKLYG